MNFNQMCDKIPWGTQTKSKINISKEILIERAKGAVVFDLDGKSYIDFDCSKGAISLGYAFEPVDNYVKEVIDKGVLFPTSSLLEVEAISKVLSYYPNMSWGRFLTSGGAVNIAACNIARVLKNKPNIIFLSYAGWMFDKHFQTNSFFMDISSDLFDYKKLEQEMLNSSAILIPGWEPYNFFNRRINKIISLAKKHNLIIILDLISIGNRVQSNSMNIYSADMITLGKSIANGYSCSLLIGKEEFRKPIDTFKTAFSETHASNRVGIAAMYKTIDYYHNEKVFDYIFNLSNYLYKALDDINKYTLYEIFKIDALIYIKWHCKKNEDIIFRHMLKNGIIYSSYIHLTKSHKIEHINKFIKVFNNIIGEVLLK